MLMVHERSFLAQQSGFSWSCDATYSLRPGRYFASEGSEFANIYSVQFFIAWMYDVEQPDGIGKGYSAKPPFVTCIKTLNWLYFIKILPKNGDYFR